MKKVLPLLLLAFVMCQCNFQSSNEKKDSLRDKYPEKFTEDYIGERTMELADKLCGCDPYNVYAFNNVFTDEYGDALKECLALPQGIDGDGPSSWIWIDYAGEFCSLEAILQVKLNGNKATAILDAPEANGTDEVTLSFVDDEWLIDDVGIYSKKHLKNTIKEYRDYYQSIDWLQYIHELEERGYNKEDAVKASDGLRQEIETYFENYPK